MSRFWRYLTTVYLALSVVSSASAASLRVPLTVEKGKLFVRASVDDAPPMLFVIDPGADSFITSFAQTQLKTSRLHTLHVGSIAVAEELPVIDDDSLGPIGGSIGEELLHRYALRIDYAGHTLTLIPFEEFRPGTQGLPMQIDSFGIPATNATVNGVSGLFEVDVRAPTSMLFTPFAKRLGFQVQRTEKHPVDRVDIGGYTQSNVPFWISAAATGKFAASDPLGLIGNNVLDSYVVTFDYRRKLVYIEPPRSETSGSGGDIAAAEKLFMETMGGGEQFLRDLRSGNF